MALDQFTKYFCGIIAMYFPWKLQIYTISKQTNDNPLVCHVRQMIQAPQTLTGLGAQAEVLRAPGEPSHLQTNARSPSNEYAIGKQD